jgi:hypothetical protein
VAWWRGARSMGVAYIFFAKIPHPPHTSRMVHTQLNMHYNSNGQALDIYIYIYTTLCEEGDGNFPIAPSKNTGKLFVVVLEYISCFNPISPLEIRTTD